MLDTPSKNSIPCRCKDVWDVRDCHNGCVLFVCCGGYVIEGHMTDCNKPKSDEIYGLFKKYTYTGPSSTK